MTPNDPLFPLQWYLKNTGQAGGTPGIDINVEKVWDDYNGAGVTVGVYDDGVETEGPNAHPDLVERYDPALEPLFLNGSVNGQPLSDQPGFYPQKDYVVTRFVAELSWLFESLRDVFGSSIDSQSRFPFYGRLAAAADRYAASKSPESQTASELLSAVLKEARQMTGEFA